MKLLAASSLLSLFLSSAAHAAEAPTGHVYLYDRESATRPPQAQSVDPEAARLIFAQRLGVSQFESLDSQDKDVLQQLNWFGGRWQVPFHIGQQAPQPSKRVIVFIEGVKDAERLMGCESAAECPYVQFTMSSPPSADANEALLADYRSLSKSLYPPGSYSSGHAQFHEVLKALQKPNHDDLVTSVHDNVFVHIDINKVVRASYDETVTFLHGAMSEILKIGKEHDMSLTIALFPASGKQVKRSGDEYGKRNSKQTEAPMTVPSPGSKKLSPAEEPEDAMPVSPANSTVIKGILPSCFGTLNACQTSTANCTGHGACFRKYKDPSHDNRECWTCGCKATVSTDSAGRKTTTNWGGPACQKIDISVPFWIIAGFTVVLVGTISWAIGLLFTMGSEELPSVIGAGVSGPRAK